jgi:hypothetical protein
MTEENPILLQLSELDENPGPYCMSFGFDLAPLIQSIKEVGLINPPLILRNREGRAEVVAGYRRILALKSLQREEIRCMDLTSAGLDPLKLLLLNLYDNLATREFNEVEKAMILKRLIPHISKEKIVERYMALLNLPSREEILDFYLRLEGLAPAIRHSLVERRVSIQAIKPLMEMDCDSRSGIFGCISKLQLNFNQQIQFIDYITDISIKEQKEIKEILKEDLISGLLDNEKLNNPQKARRLLGLLKSLRFPALTRSEEAFRKKISTLNLPKGLRIDHPPFFEGEGYTLEIRFKEGRELREKINALSRLQDLESITDPWMED